MALPAVNMQDSCCKKQRCLSGPNAGQVYDTCDPCQGTGDFDSETCDCVAQPGYYFIRYANYKSYGSVVNYASTSCSSISSISSLSNTVAVNLFLTMPPTGYVEDIRFTDAYHRYDGACGFPNVSEQRRLLEVEVFDGSQWTTVVTKDENVRIEGCCTDIGETLYSTRLQIWRNANSTPSDMKDEDLFYDSGEPVAGAEIPEGKTAAELTPA